MTALPPTSGQLIYLPVLDSVRQHLTGNVVLAVFATISIALRLYGRHFSLGYGWDDLLIVFAWMFSMALLAESGFREWHRHRHRVGAPGQVFLTMNSCHDRRWIQLLHDRPCFPGP